MSKSFTRLAVLAAAASVMATPAIAEGEWSGNVTLTSNYVFRGITQTDEGPAVQGGFDYASDSFYVGTWASAIDYDNGTSAEIDFYGGWTPTVGVFDLDIGAIYYYYPDAPDDPEQNFAEVYAGASTTLGEFVDVGASIAYSPEFYGETGDAFYYSASAGIPLGEYFGVDASVGYSSGDEDEGFTDYTDWSIGLTTSVEGFDFDFRYIDTDLDSVDESFVVSVSRAL
ncbi:TorF family putative porin [Henriciella aquimarina]|uniref:TorF family putative porin n=1 Tax=Henriciella aquimarina TaxID=545261 RepID=UPI0009FC94E5|nr:TorF family putative porin [Henriciella aquimarina]